MAPNDWLNLLKSAQPNKVRSQPARQFPWRSLVQHHFLPTVQIRSVQAAIEGLHTCEGSATFSNTKSTIQWRYTSQNNSKDGSHCGSSSHFQSFCQSCSTCSILISPLKMLPYPSCLRSMIQSCPLWRSAELLQRKECLGHMRQLSQRLDQDIWWVRIMYISSSVFGDDRAIPFSKAIPNLPSALRSVTPFSNLCPRTSLSHEVAVLYIVLVHIPKIPWAW